MPRVALLVRCDGCGGVFDTGIRMDRRNFARATLASNYHTCPACGRRGTYRKDHYIVQEDAAARDRCGGGRGGPAPGRDGSTDGRNTPNTPRHDPGAR